MTVEQIEAAILNLSETDFAKLRNWLLDLDYQQWDRQLEQDILDGKMIQLKKPWLTLKLETINKYNAIYRIILLYILRKLINIGRLEWENPIGLQGQKLKMGFYGFRLVLMVNMID